MRYECTIPIMKAQDPKILERFGALGKVLPNMEESLEELRDFFDHAILDLFPRLLPEEDPKISLLDCEYFRLAVEKHYLNFVRRIFEENGKVCYWHTREFLQGDMQSYLYKIKLMDRIDEMIYSKQFEIKEGNTLFRIEDLEILEFAVRGFMRELLRGGLFFEKHPFAIVSNYDLSLPVLAEKKEDLAHYRELARSSGLYFR